MKKLLREGIEVVDAHIESLRNGILNHEGKMISTDPDDLELFADLQKAEAWRERAVKALDAG